MATCMEMCPREERRLREEQRRLHSSEIIPDTAHLPRPKANPRTTVKEFSRSAAGKREPTSEELRPPHVLLQTIHYLVSSLLTREDTLWVELYNFVFDRLHAVRQDVVLQQPSSIQCIHILEPIIRFYVYAGYRLHDEPIHSYDPYINNSHLQQCLKTLLVCYESVEETTENRPEFESVYLLHNLGSMEALSHAMTLSPSIRSHPTVNLAMSINRAYTENNFIRLFSLIDKCSRLQLYALHRHLPDIRRHILYIMNIAYSSRNTKFPIGLLTQWLRFQSELDTMTFCELHGLTVDNKTVCFLKSAFTAPEKQPSFGYHSRFDMKIIGEAIPELILSKTLYPEDNQIDAMMYTDMADTHLQRLGTSQSERTGQLNHYTPSDDVQSDQSISKEDWDTTQKFDRLMIDQRQKNDTSDMTAWHQRSELSSDKSTTDHFRTREYDRRQNETSNRTAWHQRRYTELPVSSDKTTTDLSTGQYDRKPSVEHQSEHTTYHENRYTSDRDYRKAPHSADRREGGGGSRGQGGRRRGREVWRGERRNYRGRGWRQTDTFDN
ncbi:SAC3 domain-containing protein 1-like [Glandiceps talaboti]